ncbi:MAG: glycosyltransferase [Alphaproteobacteria bacterium]
MTPQSAIAGYFEQGDYHRVAVQGADSDWRTHAARGMCGDTLPALARLPGFDSPDARFYEGVIRWIDGDESAAIRVLAPLDNAHADNLLRLIRKPRISILSQLSWYRSTTGPHNVLRAGEQDPKFDIRNISFAPGDLPNRPDADIHDYYDAASPPDLYLSEMIEWHVVPPNIQELPCPLIGQTADYDIHIQTLYPWLRAFDEIVVTDSTEYADLRGLVDVPVTTFSKPYSLPLDLPAPIVREKDLDLVITGSLYNSFYPDKADMLRQILSSEDIRPFFYNGFFPADVYYQVLARSKLTVALTRHPGATPTRGFEALAMGTVLLVPVESCLRLFTGDQDGVVPFSLANDGLQKAIGAVMADYERYAEGARRGAEIVRREFDPMRASRQYLRMAVFLAARPRPPRIPLPERTVQSRSVSFKGFLQANGETTYRAMRDRRLQEWQAKPLSEHTLASLTLPARELLLEYEFRSLMQGGGDARPLVTMALEIYRKAFERFPLSLALRFNFIRAAFHFGSNSDIEQALGILKGTLNVPPGALALNPLDDILTWDYCPDFFNYRTYLQITTESLRDRTNRQNELKALIRASLHYYYGRMSGEQGHFDRAVALDRDFPAYRLWQAKELDRRGDADSAKAAIPILTDVVREILFTPEAWSLLQSLKAEHSLDIPAEASLHRLVDRMERRTLIDEAYLAIRYGRYFRAQRLALARNTGYEIRKSPDTPGHPQLSILLADTNGSRYAGLMAGLARQTLDRTAFEIICCDVFDRSTPHMIAGADTVLVFGQSEYLYNRNVGFNTALAQARGRHVIFFNGDADLPETALHDWLGQIGAAGNCQTVFVNRHAGPADSRSIHTVLLRRQAAIMAGGLDESAYHAGAYGGPHDLVQRAGSLQWPLENLSYPGTTPAISKDNSDMTLTGLLRDVWPDKFTATRTEPLRKNPDIARMQTGDSL